MLDLLMPRRAAAAVPASQDSYFEPFARRTTAGVDINEQKALTFSTVFLCQRILSEAISCMPISCYQRLDDGERRTMTAKEIPGLEALAFPNEDMTGVGFRDSRTGHQINYNGGGFAEIVRDRGRIELHPIHPNRVSPARTGSDYFYEVRNNDGRNIGMYREEMLHLLGAIPDDGIWSKGIVTWARETFGGALATDMHGWAFFGSGAQPKGVLMAPGLKNREDRREFRKEWKQIHASPDSQELAILTSKDSSYTPISSSNQANQFTESRAFNRKVICEWYRVPVYMIGERTPSGNIEAQATDFIMYSLSPWAIKWEQELNRKLLRRDQRMTHRFEHDFSSLLRGDIKTRMDAYRVGLMSGVYTINRCRRLENEPGIGPAGDITLVPANLVTADYMREHGSGGSASGPGSNHSGAPADNPLDHEPAMREQAFEEWRRTLPKMMSDELSRQLRTFEERLQDRKTDWRESARLTLTDALEWLLTKEAGAAQRAISGKGDFEAWLREFYAKHETLMADKLQAACSTLRLAGIVKWADRLELAAWLRARSVEELRRAYNHDSKEAVERKLAAWPTQRAADIAEEILRS